jgi:hypothetical protein
MKGILLSIFTLLLLTGSAYAIETGNDLLSACEVFERNAIVSAEGLRFDRSPPPEAYMCFGFMNALQQVTRWQSTGDSLPTLEICAPEKSKLTQLIRVFTNYARAHPEELHEQAASVATIALRLAFPCR